MSLSATVSGFFYYYGTLPRRIVSINQLSKLEIALKLADESTFLFDEFKNRAELKDHATLILHDIKEPDEGR